MVKHIIYPTPYLTLTNLVKQIGVKKFEEIERAGLSNAKVQLFLKTLRQANIPIDDKIINKAFSRLEKQRILTAAQIENIKQACRE